MDIYGKVRKEFTSDDVANRRSGFMPFLYAGQYYDRETDLAYNRFRYYSPDTGAYISQDPIGLAGGNPTLYGYVFDNNTWVDVFGLLPKPSKVVFDIKDLHPDTITKSHPDGIYEIPATGDYTADKKALYAKANIKESFNPEWISHHIDYDEDTNIMRMQLVKKEAHKIGHTGGVKEYREVHNGIGYDTSNKKNKICNS